MEKQRDKAARRTQRKLARKMSAEAGGQPDGEVANDFSDYLPNPETPTNPNE